MEEAFVPDNRAIPSEHFFNPGMPTHGTELHGNPLYVGRPAGPYHTSLVCPIIGAAKAAIDEFREIIMVKPTSFYPQVPRYQFHEDQRALGTAIARADAAEAIVLSFADDYIEAARESMETGVAMPMQRDARWRATCATRPPIASTSPRSRATSPCATPRSRSARATASCSEGCRRRPPRRSS